MKKEKKKPEQVEETEKVEEPVQETEEVEKETAEAPQEPSAEEKLQALADALRAEDARAKRGEELEKAIPRKEKEQGGFP